MSVSTKRIHGKDYLYLEAGRSKTLLLGPADSHDPEDFKSERVRYGLNYLLQNLPRYLENFRVLISLLPEDERQAYTSRLRETILSKEERRRLPKAQQEGLAVIVGRIRVTLHQLKLNIQSKEPHKTTLKDLPGLESDTKRIASAIDRLDGELDTLVALAHQSQKEIPH
ncbi:MAG: hypothetical protein JRM94_04670 [Nitrososphaerota archaeon]|nr:hypothetical protein [Nitrososphaerota archaeon]